LCELFALSSQLATRVTFSLEEFSQHGVGRGRLADGWGLAFYDGPDAQVFREPRPAASSEWMKFILSHSYYSNCVMSHIRQASIGSIALRNTQPFSRVLRGKRHVFCHNGDLADIQNRIRLETFLPIGETDSEYGFCRLMDRLSTLWQWEAPGLDERIDVISEVLVELSCLGPTNVLYSDSEFLYAFSHKRTQANGRLEAPGLYYQERHCDCDPDALQDSGVQIHNMAQDLVLFASVPLSTEGWRAAAASQLIVVKHGKIIASRNLQ
jgi:predicted glutamine amidotransferase